jgi:hypothetical protein
MDPQVVCGAEQERNRRSGHVETTEGRSSSTQASETPYFARGRDGRVRGSQDVTEPGPADRRAHWCSTGELEDDDLEAAMTDLDISKQELTAEDRAAGAGTDEERNSSASSYGLPPPQSAKSASWRGGGPLPAPGGFLEGRGYIRADRAVLADRRPGPGRHTGGHRVRADLAGHPEGRLLIHPGAGRLERDGRPRRRAGRGARPQGTAGWRRPGPGQRHRPGHSLCPDRWPDRPATSLRRRPHLRPGHPDYPHRRQQPRCHHRRPEPLTPATASSRKEAQQQPKHPPRPEAGPG